MPHSLVFLTMLGSGVGTLMLCKFADVICNKLELIDKPDTRKLHPRPTPLMGGLALLLVGMPANFIILFSGQDHIQSNTLFILILATSAMIFVGLADDRHDLTARDRLFISFLVFGSVYIFSPLFVIRILDFSVIPISIGLGNSLISIFFMMLCCVGLVNAVNMADGKNGLVSGLILGWLAFFATRAPSSLLPVIAGCGAVAAVLFYFNLKGRLFLGDGGAYGFATLIALLSIILYNTADADGSKILYAEEIVLLFSVPVGDAIRLAITRVAQGKSPMAADRNHLHHHLQSRFGWPGGLVAYHLLALGLPISAIFMLA